MRLARNKTGTRTLETKTVNRKCFSHNRSDHWFIYDGSN
ncbi:hypothetical protein Bhyg_09788, partial [Pseudolycoriella hygida]